MSIAYYTTKLSAAIKITLFLLAMFDVNRLEPVVDKTQQKVIDPQRPVLRGLTSTPEMPRVPKLPRAGTSRASIGQPTADSLVMPSRLSLAPPAVRQGPLSKIQLLPSKFTSK